MTREQLSLQAVYIAFNGREFESVLAVMKPDVKWANGMDGGFVFGREAVREYWRKQFEITKSELDPIKFEVDENGRNVVTVHLIVRDIEGEVLADKTVKQIFTFENDLISLFEIADAEPLRLIKDVK